MLMEDRSALLRELHSQVLGKVLEEDGGDKPRFEKELVDSYFNEKILKIQHISLSGL